MNKIRRKKLQSIIYQLEELKGCLEELQAEEEEYRDNMPENLWGSKRYEKADEAIVSMEEAVISFEDAICNIDAAME